MFFFYVSEKVVSFRNATYGSTFANGPSSKQKRVGMWFRGSTWPAEKDSLQELSGSGLWKLSVYSSETDVAAVGAPDFAQVLSAEQSSASLSGGMLFVQGDEVVVDGMGGCSGEKSFVCYLFDQGDSPNPEFTLASTFTGCLNFDLKCEKVR